MKDKEYPCKFSPTGMCKHGGNKHYNYGFVSGTAEYCHLAKIWTSKISKCPKHIILHQNGEVMMTGIKSL
jgi:hypothetical protein